MLEKLKDLIVKIIEEKQGVKVVELAVHPLYNIE